MLLAVFYSDNFDSTLSYNYDWLDAFRGINNNQIKIDTYNLMFLGFREWIEILKKYEWFIFLHSTNSNEIKLNRFHRLSLFFRKGKIAFFVGNEYKLIPEKISLLKMLHADLIVSQLPQDTANWLYSGVGAKIISLPHALNHHVFKPLKNFKDRVIDIGNRSCKYPWYLGDIDRIKVLEFAELLKGKGFNMDISTDPAQRFDRLGWCRFLNECKFTIATEAGTGFLEKNDETRKKVNRYITEHKEATFEEVYEKFFKNYKNPVSGKCISSRHFDAIGTKTCQILLEGQYNNILKPNEHYLELKKDFSNVGEVIEKMRDEKIRKRIVDNAYEHAITHHMHRHRITQLMNVFYKCGNDRFNF